MVNEKQVKWWPLYLIALVMVMLLVAEHRVPLPWFSPQIVDGGIVVASFGAMWVWLQSQNGSLAYEEVERNRAQRDLKMPALAPQFAARDSDWDALLKSDSLPAFDHVGTGPAPEWDRVDRSLLN
jgi:hypothetical protein